MKIKRIIAAAAAVLMLTAVSCGEKKDNYVSPFDSGSESSQGLFDEMSKAGDAEQSSEEEAVTEAPVVVEAAEDGPRIYMKDASASPGEEVEITLAVENSAKKWCMCGIHVTYPDFLECVMMDEEEGFAEYEPKEASQYSTGAVAMLWSEGLPEVLTSKNLGCIFFTEMFGGKDYGGEGDIVTFTFKVPEDAEPGTYPLGFYYRDTDMFIDTAQDLSMQKYVFENWREGTLTIE
ncbi:MAG: cohesin domain-containing protein [Alistipes sp.]|nr:cohesin domain-containing protein [Alistipes sp.]